jgi:hypothetical protein
MTARGWLHAGSLGKAFSGVDLDVGELGVDIDPAADLGRAAAQARASLDEGAAVAAQGDADHGLAHAARRTRPDLQDQLAALEDLAL